MHRAITVLFHKLPSLVKYCSQRAKARRWAITRSSLRPWRAGRWLYTVAQRNVQMGHARGDDGRDEVVGEYGVGQRLVPQDSLTQAVAPPHALEGAHGVNSDGCFVLASTTLMPHASCHAFEILVGDAGLLFRGDMMTPPSERALAHLLYWAGGSLVFGRRSWFSWAYSLSALCLTAVCIR